MPVGVSGDDLWPRKTLANHGDPRRLRPSRWVGRRSSRHGLPSAASGADRFPAPSSSPLLLEGSPPWTRPIRPAGRGRALVKAWLVRSTRGSADLVHSGAWKAAIRSFGKSPLRGSGGRTSSETTFPAPCTTHSRWRRAANVAVQVQRRRVAEVLPQRIERCDGSLPVVRSGGAVRRLDALAMTAASRLFRRPRPGRLAKL